jgi:UDP-N-acetyl-D-mannosaminuronic acid transferase (WecB/TagA/CpsF family)
VKRNKSENYIRVNDTIRILGINFFLGTAHDAARALFRSRGLLVVPAAPALVTMERDLKYTEAVINADFAIIDSTYMAVCWFLLSGQVLPKLSGLTYIRALLSLLLEMPESVLWVLPTQASCVKTEIYLNKQGFLRGSYSIYHAPFYGLDFVGDTTLVDLLEKNRPQHVIIGLGGGTQEKLGSYIRRELSYKPAIHCIGAAIAFLTGDQVNIPKHIDTLGLGWLYRCISDPVKFVPRYASGLRLFPMMLRYRSESPGSRR